MVVIYFVGLIFLNKLLNRVVGPFQAMFFQFTLEPDDSKQLLPMELSFVAPFFVLIEKNHLIIFYERFNVIICFAKFGLVSFFILGLQSCFIKIVCFIFKVLKNKTQLFF